MSTDSDPRFETVRGFNDDVFVELWDRTLAPAGLAFLLRKSPEGLVTLTGFDVDVPVDIFHRFFDDGLAYVSQAPEALLKRHLDDAEE